MKEKVDAAELLKGMDLDFLEMVMSDAKKGLSWVDSHPEFQQIASKLVGLYNEITEKALLLEKASK